MNDLEGDGDKEAEVRGRAALSGPRTVAEVLAIPAAAFSDDISKLSDLNLVQPCAVKHGRAPLSLEQSPDDPRG